MFSIHRKFLTFKLGKNSTQILGSLLQLLNTTESTDVFEIKEQWRLDYYKNYFSEIMDYLVSVYDETENDLNLIYPIYEITLVVFKCCSLREILDNGYIDFVMPVLNSLHSINIKKYALVC